MVSEDKYSTNIYYFSLEEWNNIKIPPSNSGIDLLIYPTPYSTPGTVFSIPKETIS